MIRSVWMSVWKMIASFLSDRDYVWPVERPAKHSKTEKLKLEN